MSQEVAVRNDEGGLVPDQATPGIDLRVWAEQATAAAVYAERVCSTQMVPIAYKGKPAEAAAAILAGAELGFGPMASLRAFHPINGTPAPAAITLRAVVTGHGHEVIVEESSSERAVISGRRKGTDTWQTSVWDIARAKLMPQYDKNPNWKQNPAAMLVARATAEVCRWVASDAIMGMPYAAEEIADQAVIESPPAVRRLTAAELDAPTAEAEMIGPDQCKHMRDLWSELGYDGDANRDARLAITAKILSLPDLESSSDLTRAEADQVIAALIERRDRMANGGEA